MGTRARRLLLMPLLALGPLTACPDYNTELLPCNRDMDCAAGQRCIDGLCQAAMPVSDAGARDIRARDGAAQDLAAADLRADARGDEDGAAGDSRLGDSFIADSSGVERLPWFDVIPPDQANRPDFGLFFDVRAADRGPGVDLRPGDRYGTDATGPPILSSGTLYVDGDRWAEVTPQQLNAIDGDTRAAELVYTVLSPPIYGTLFCEGRDLDTGETFTQLDLDREVVVYIHAGSFASGDSFSVEVTDGQHTVGPATVNIVINIQPLLGDGRDGPLHVDSGVTVVVNTCVPLLYPGGPDSVVVASWPSAIRGMRVLLHQVQEGFATSGDQHTIDQNHIPGLAGLWVMQRISDVVHVADGTTVLTLQDGELFFPFGSDGEYGARAQICHIPEYTSVNVELGGTISAPEWDGASGGVLAFFATEGLTLNGILSATGAGFRGGEIREGANIWNVEALDTDDTPGSGGVKGEGMDGTSFSHSGRGNYGNGAGGGNGINAGGGGGGHGGAGGNGGRQYAGADDSKVTFGMPGVAVDLPRFWALSFGGGGGAGHPDGSNDGSGGDGGGAVVVSVDQLAGNGTVYANGLVGHASVGDGAGGGGAGGLISLRARVSSFDGALRANGANGGDITGSYVCGPGGGGGGGIIETIGLGSTPGCHAWQGGGGSNASGELHGATDGVQGRVLTR